MIDNMSTISNNLVQNVIIHYTQFKKKSKTYNILSMLILILLLIYIDKIISNLIYFFKQNLVVQQMYFIIHIYYIFWLFQINDRIKIITFHSHFFTLDNIL